MRSLNKFFTALFAVAVCCVFVTGCSKKSSETATAPAPVFEHASPEPLPDEPEVPKVTKPKYVFLFIGDGMSIPQRMVTEQFSMLTRGKGLAINNLQCQGVTTTSSADSFITDSAASGTAIACGEKTNNGRIGMDAEGTRRLESSAEVAKAAGKKVGMVTSVTINHATPAAFYAHNVSRVNYYQIGLDLIASGFDYFGGGGVAQNNKNDDPLYKGDIYELAKEAGYIVARNRAEFEAITPGEGKKVLASGAPNELPYDIDMGPEDIHLVEFTRQAIAMLEDGPNGFFLMVEGGLVDYMCHANDAAATIREVLALDECVELALDFAAKHPGETLIVVTGDHETGGMTLGFAGTAYQSFIQNLAAQTCSQEAMIVKFNALQGKTFDEAKGLITECSGLIFDQPDQAKLGNLYLTANEQAEIQSAFDRQFKDGGNNGHGLTTAVIKMLDNKSAIGWTSGAHTALPVSTTASGVGAENFSNVLDNTNIAQRLKELVK
ncbi:MAG: alkaline phosphatase [Victivallales bacterium]|jgi:alkaline phosphatase|nr:alkaline phosphatase [Victivallales bacterium]